MEKFEKNLQNALRYATTMDLTTLKEKELEKIQQFLASINKYMGECNKKCKTSSNKTHKKKSKRQIKIIDKSGNGGGSKNNDKYAGKILVTIFNDKAKISGKEVKDEQFLESEEE